MTGLTTGNVTKMVLADDFSLFMFLSKANNHLPNPDQQVSTKYLGVFVLGTENDHVPPVINSHSPIAIKILSEQIKKLLLSTSLSWFGSPIHRISTCQPMDKKIQP